MLANVLVVLVIAGSCFVALEIFLGEQDKQRLLDFLVRLWNFLDDLRKRRWLTLLHRTSTRVLMLGVAVLLICSFFTYAFMQRRIGLHIDLTREITLIAWLGLGALVIGFLLIRFVLNADSLTDALWRATIGIGVAVLPNVLAILAVFVWPDKFVVEGAPTLLQMLWLIFVVSSSLITTAVFLAWSTVALPLAVIIVLQTLITAMEFFLRRLAEYPKGPIVAATLLAGALAAVFKVFA